MTHPRSKSSADVVPPLIQVVGIGKTYIQSAGAVPALGEICLEVQKGDLIAVVGPSGSGKSTLMNLLGLLDVPSVGHYALAGRDVSRLSADEQASVRNKSIGFIYQAFNLLARSKAVENVELPLVYGGARKKDRQRRALQALEEVGLSHRRDHWPHELSGGEQQRVAIARALVSNPELILADEPTGALDSKTSAEILHILQGLNQRGITVIIVTHNPSVAARARRIVELADGRIVRDEKVEPTRGYPPQPAEWLNEEARGPVRMAFAEGVRAAFRALRANILRTGLTMLGIIIGVAAVITMVAIGSGAQQRVEEEIRSLGANLLLIQPGSQRSGGMRLAAGTRQTLTEADAASIAREIEDIEAVAPGVSTAVQIVHGNRNWSTNLAGITPEYLQAREWPIAAGRSFSAHEVASGAKVVLLGATVAQELFGNTHPIGRIVRVDNIPMNVIGTLSEKGQSPFGRDQDDVALVPISTAKLRILSGSHVVNRGTVDTIMVKVSSPAARSAVQDRMATLLRMRHRLRNGAEDDFQIRDLASIASAQSEASRSLTIMLAAVAAVSLVVGGISIMNIMLISVHERTREIGLRMALGARRRDIRRQFLVEVAIVCAIGGVVGVIVGTGAALAISQYAGWDVHVSPEVAFASVSFATAIGVFFGLYPANRAGRMNPIAALRFE